MCPCACVLRMCQGGVHIMCHIPGMYVNWCEHVCLYLVSTKSSTEKQSSSAIVVHEAKRTATSTRTIYTRHNKPYRLGAAPAGVVGTRSRCCPAATVPAAVVFACGFRCCFAEITPTFSPWTHTSDDSYIYQLSLVLATATVSFIVPRP